MKKRNLVFVALLLFCATAAVTQEVLVDYVEGTVELRRSTGWTELHIGDAVSADATLRLRNGSLLELRSAERSYLISHAGTYALSSIIESTGRNSEASIGAVALQRLRRLITDDGQRNTTVSGVRGDEALDGSEVTWAGGESVEELIEEGVTLLNEGAVEDAYYAFYDAWEYAGDGELPRAQFYLGYSAYLIGNRAEAFGYLENPAPNPETEYYDDHLLTLAQILVESFDYGCAKELLDGYLARGESEGTDLQTAYLLTGLAHQGEEELGEARNAFAHARAIDPSSEFGELAASFIAEM